MNNKYTKELLESIIAGCRNWADVCRKVGIQPMTGSQSNLKKRALSFGIDTSHFLGCASNKGKIFGPKRSIDYFLTKNGPYIKSSDLKLRLFKENIKKKECEICQRTMWNNDTLPLELHHKDCNHYNNQLDNLQILCSNCHTQIHAHMAKSVTAIDLESIVA